MPVAVLYKVVYIMHSFQFVSGICPKQASKQTNKPKSKKTNKQTKTATTTTTTNKQTNKQRRKKVIVLLQMHFDRKLFTKACIKVLVDQL